MWAFEDCRDKNVAINLLLWYNFIRVIGKILHNKKNKNIIIEEYAV
jgi:hypothetical protein